MLERGKGGHKPATALSCIQRLGSVLRIRERTLIVLSDLSTDKLRQPSRSASGETLRWGVLRQLAKTCMLFTLGECFGYLTAGQPLAR